MTTLNDDNEHLIYRKILIQSVNLLKGDTEVKGSTTHWQEAIKRIEKVRYYSLTSVDLNGLELSQLPYEIFQLKNIQRLDLYNNELSSLPVEITQLENLQSLDLSHNKFTTFPIEVTKLRNLQWLTLRNNYLNTLPTEISQLENLVWLDIVNNHLTAFPPEITQLAKLESLHCNHNPLNSIPTTITRLRYLRHLSLSNTLLQTLSTSITQLDTLQQLDLSYNQLTTLPDEIAQLNNLQRFNLSHNKLSVLPKEICHFKKSLNLHGNYKTLTSPPIEIIKQGWNAIEHYFQEIENRKGRIYEAKLIVIGEGGAGKTSLIGALRGEALDPLESKTEGIEVTSITLNKEETGLERDFRLNMWDFGGQEIYKDTHRFFLTRDTVYILVTESRKNINYNDIYYWLNSLKVFAPDAPVLLVQNKCEMHNASFDIEAYKESFSNLVPWAQLLRTSCIPEEAHTITKLRKAIIQTLCDPELAPNVGDEIPAKWVEIRAELAKMQGAGEKTLAYNDFIKLCNEHGLTDTQSVTTLAGYFFRIGVFTYYAENLLLKRTIFLDNEWLTKGVYQIIDNAKVQANQGLFTESDLATLYQGTDYAGREAEFANLMQEFKICYKVDESERTYRCPLILPEATPETVKVAEWQQANNLHFAFDYKEFMPRGILSTLIVNMHKDIYQESLWKRGVVLEDNDTQALVYEGLNKKHIHIYIRGQNKRDFLTIIARELQKIHHEFNNLTHEGKLACPCSQCINNPNAPHFFEAEVIFRRWRKGITTVRCDRNDEEISTAQLAGYMTHLPQKMDDTKSIHIENMNMLGGNMMSNDAYNFYGNAKGNIGGQGNTYNEHQQNSGIYTNISNSNIGGNVTIKDNQVHNQQVDIDTETLTAELEALIKQLKAKIANDEDDDNVYEAAKSARKAHKELTTGSQQTAIAVLQKSGRWFGEFANNVGANVVAGLILGALPQPR